MYRLGNANYASLSGPIVTCRILHMAAHASGARLHTHIAASSRSGSTNTSFHPVSRGFFCVHDLSLTWRCLEAVMDMVGHFERPTSHIDFATASLEDYEAAIQVVKSCIAHYTTLSETLDKLMHTKLREEAGGSVI